MVVSGSEAAAQQAAAASLQLVLTVSATAIAWVVLAHWTTTARPTLAPPAY